MNVLIAAGGTGGHVFPGIALAEAVARRSREANITFIGTPRGLESYLIPKTPWRLVTMNVPSLKDRRGIRRLLAFFALPSVLFRAYRLVRSIRPSLVISIGGYAGGPVVLAAWMLRIPTAILEPNAIAGVTNRWLGKIAQRVFTGFAESAVFFPPHKVVVTGNPVRAEVLEVKEVTHDMQRLTIFCFGGSQGARRINHAVVEALEHLGELRTRVAFIHQTGSKEDIEAVRRTYEQQRVSAVVLPFIDHMAEYYQRADLVVARSGATTVAELLALAKPAILVPYPYAADDHQRANAECLVRLGGALMIRDEEFTGRRLAEVIRSFLESPETLRRMQSAMQGKGYPHAAERVIEECWKMMAA